MDASEDGLDPDIGEGVQRTGINRNARMFNSLKMQAGKFQELKRAYKSKEEGGTDVYYTDEGTAFQEINEIWSPCDLIFVSESVTSFFSFSDSRQWSELEPSERRDLVASCLECLECANLQRKAAAILALLYISTGCHAEHPNSEDRKPHILENSALLFDCNAIPILLGALCATSKSGSHSSVTPFDVACMVCDVLYIILVCNCQNQAFRESLVSYRHHGTKSVVEVLLGLVKDITSAAPVAQPPAAAAAPQDACNIPVKKAVLLLHRALLCCLGPSPFSVERRKSGPSSCASSPTQCSPMALQSTPAGPPPQGSSFSFAPPPVMLSMSDGYESDSSTASAVSLPSLYLPSGEEEEEAERASAAFEQLHQHQQQRPWRGQLWTTEAGKPTLRVKARGADVAEAEQRMDSAVKTSVYIPRATREALQIVSGASAHSTSPSSSLEPPAASTTAPAAGSALPRHLLKPNETSFAEHLYKNNVSELPAFLLALLKVFLAAIPNIKNYTGSVDLHRELASSPTAEAPANEVKRHKDTVLCAVVSSLHLILAHFKKNCSLQFEYVAQIVVDANGLLLLLKHLNQDAAALCFPPPESAAPTLSLSPFWLALEEDEQRIVCSASGSSAATSPPTENEPADADSSDKPKGEGEENGAATNSANVVDRRSARILVQVLLLLHKICKDSPHRIATLVSYKAHVITKRLVKIQERNVLHYGLKLIKAMMPFLGKRWRQGNMRIVSLIYQHIAPQMKDPWLSLELQADDPNNIALDDEKRKKVEEFNKKNYLVWWKFVPPKDGVYEAAFTEDSPIPMDPLEVAFASTKTHVKESFERNYSTWLDNLLEIPAHVPLSIEPKFSV